MNWAQQNSRWINIVGLVLIVLLSSEVLLLIHENSELHDLLTNPSAVGFSRMIQPGDTLTSFAFQIPTSDSVTLHNESWNRSVLIFIFSTTCPFCETNVPKWKMLFGVLQLTDLDILGLCIDPPAVTSSYMQEQDIPFTVLSTFIDANFRERTHLRGVPVTLLVHSNGIVERVWPGVLSENDLEEILTVLRDTVAQGAD